MADGSNGLVVLDITNPAAPTLVGTYDTNFAQSVVVSGNYAFIADDSTGIVIVNIANPAALVSEGSFNTAGFAYDVAVSNNYVYVADFGNGLVILSVDGAADTIPPASVTNLKEASSNSSWINWAWINPSDADFSHVTVYIDGVFITNTSEASYNLTNLTEGSIHTIGSKPLILQGILIPHGQTIQQMQQTGGGYYTSGICNKP